MRVQVQIGYEEHLSGDVIEIMNDQVILERLGSGHVRRVAEETPLKRVPRPASAASQELVEAREALLKKHAELGEAHAQLTQEHQATLAELAKLRKK